MENLLEVKNLNLSFQLDKKFAAQALYDVSFSIKKGQTLGVVGESGCGKSITALSIMKLLPKNSNIISGEIIFNGNNLFSLNDKEIQSLRGQKIVLIPQDPLTSLNPLYTVGEQISEVIEFHQKKSKKEAKLIAIEMMAQVNIPEPASRFNDYPHQFSGGMRQRIIIAMALSCNPQLIIADEPTTALDVTVQAQILNLIKSVQEKYNTSLMLITHDLGVISEICNYVAVMYAGHVVEQADVQSLFSTPLHPYTRGLMASLPDKATGDLNPIKGQPPSITEHISGCPFYPRCSSKIEICEDVNPSYSLRGENHKVKCHLYN